MEVLLIPNHHKKEKPRWSTLWGKAQGLKRAGCIEEIGPNSVWLEHE